MAIILFYTVTMPDHTSRSQDTERDEAQFYPVDGLRGHCKCGNYLHFISREGEQSCDECGRVWNIYVDHDLWEEP